MNLKSKVLQTVPGTLLSGPLMTTHKSINAIQLIPFRSRSLYPNDYWTAPTNRKFKFNHPELNKPPIFPLRFTLFLSWQIRLTKPVTYTTSLRVPSLSFPTSWDCHIGKCMFNSVRKYTFSKVAGPFYALTSKLWVFQFASNLSFLLVDCLSPYRIFK